MNGAIICSFIIPHKNCPELLERCVNSIPVRDDVQIIVVDDNSDEGKKPLLPERKGLEIVLLDASQSKGAGKARNVGLEKAEGKWLLFPDSDDYYVDGFFDVLGKYFNCDLDVVYFNCEYRDGITKALLPPIYFIKDFEEYDGSQEAIDKIKFHHNAPWTKMIRRNYLSLHNIRFEEVPNGNDLLFTMVVGSFTNKIDVLKTPLYVYMRNVDSLTQKKQTEGEVFCVILHTIQLNRFFDRIGYPEWRIPIFKKILYYMRVSGLSFFTLFIKRTIAIKKYRNNILDRIRLS